MMQLLRYERRGTAIYMDGEQIGTCSTPEAADHVVEAVNAECDRIERALDTSTSQTMKGQRIMKQTLLILAIVVALAGFSACKQIQPKAQAVQVSQAAITDTEVEAQTTKERHYCAGITKAGRRCRKPVKTEGDYCWMHRR